MFDCSSDLLAYHDDEINLPTAERDNMRERRNSNRDRLRRRLKIESLPSVREFKSQGSYAMRTMTQHEENDYDIDDGVYFEAVVLVGARDAEMSALQARYMVRDALDDGSFKTPPEVHKNCVRVFYVAGYHVDMPVYRRVVSKDLLGRETVHHELASSEWKRSDARDVTEWFDEQNVAQSPDATNGRQLRRVVRELKKFARSRNTWSGQILSGFGITKLVTECYRSHATREDEAFYNTMVAIRDRLNINLVVKHPVTPGATITRTEQDARSSFLRDKLDWAIDKMAVLHKADCSRQAALHAWDEVFDTDRFEARYDPENARKAESLSAPAILTLGLLKTSAQAPAPRQAVQKSGGGNYA